jgi:single-strand DNA-binding protein
MYLNKIMIYGNLTRDPEIRALPSGAHVASLSIATNRVYTDKDGKRQEDVQYHNIVVFGKQADSAAQWLKKGSAAYVEGSLRTQSWEKDGVKQYRTEVVAERVQFGPRVGGESAPKKEQSDPYSLTPTVPDYPADEINPEDIPFN